MSSGAYGLDLAEVSKAHAPQVLDAPAAPGATNQKNEKALHSPDDSSQSQSRKESLTDDDGKEYPTPEEITTLRRVRGPVPWSSYTIAFVELCERFGYYGTTAVCGYHSVQLNMPRTDIKSQSSISFSRNYPRVHRPVPPQMVNPVHWAWVNEHPLV